MFFISTVHECRCWWQSVDKIPCKASPWWTRHRPRAPRWDLARSWARPETEKESSDGTPFLSHFPSSTHSPLFIADCLSTNKQTTEWSLQTLTLSLPGMKVRSLFTALEKSQATLRPRQNTQDLLPCRRRRSNCLCTPLSAQDSEKDLRRAHAPWRAGAIHWNVVCAIDGIVIICVTDISKAKAPSMTSYIIWVTNISEAKISSLRDLFLGPIQLYMLTHKHPEKNIQQNKHPI